MDRSEFLRVIKDKYPNLKNAINKEFGQLHGEMNVFHNFAQDCLDRDDEVALVDCFNLAASIYIKGDKKLKNAIDVSFVEGFRFSGKKWAWKILPSNLKQLYIRFHHGPGV